MDSTVQIILFPSKTLYWHPRNVFRMNFGQAKYFELKSSQHSVSWRVVHAYIALNWAYLRQHIGIESLRKYLYYKARSLSVRLSWCKFSMETNFPSSNLPPDYFKTTPGLWEVFWCALVANWLMGRLLFLRTYRQTKDFVCPSVM